MIFYSNKKYIVLSLFFLIFIEISLCSSTNDRGFEIFGGKKEGGFLSSKNVNYQKTIYDSKDMDDKLTKISNTIQIITQAIINNDYDMINQNLMDQTLISKFTKKYENFNNKENNILLKITPIINYNIFSEKKYNINNIDYSLFELFNLSKNKDANKKEDQKFLKDFNEILNKINNNIKDILNEIRNININQLELYLSEIKEYDQKIAKEELFKKETDKWTKYIDKHINESDIYKNFQNELKILEDKNEFKMQEYFYFLMQNDFFKNKDLEEILINNQNPTIFYEKNKDFINNTYNEGKIIKGFLFQYILSIIIVNTTRKELPKLLQNSPSLIKEIIEKKLIDILYINNEENEENNFIKELISTKVNNYLTFFYEQQKPKQIKNQNQNEKKEQKENKPEPETKAENIEKQEQNIKEQKNTNINNNENNIQQSQNNSLENKQNITEINKTNIKTNTSKSNIKIKNLEIPDEEESTKEKPSEENTKKENSAPNINKNLTEEKNEKIDINTNLNNINNKISELDNFLNKQIDELVDLETKIEDINENKSIEEIENLLKNSENDDKQINTIKEKIESIIKSDQNNNIESKKKLESLIFNINAYLTINKNENEIDMELINEYKKNLNEITKLINI